MLSNTKYDAVIVGAGPNGLAAAITLAQAGRSVLLIEGHDTIGGGTRSAELTLPGFIHDICSAIHPLGLASPFFRNLPLEDYGLEWIQPGVPFAHPLDDGDAVVIQQDIQATANGLGEDGEAYRRLLGPFAGSWEKLLHDLLAPFHIPRYPFVMGRFGLRAIQPAAAFARRRFKTERARAVFAGLAAHSMLPLNTPGTVGFGLMLGVLAHAVGWPMPKGGSQKIAEALGSYLESFGGEIQTGTFVGALDELPPARTVLLDVTPKQVLEIAGDRLPAVYRRSLESFRYGTGVYKLDLALDGPVPWEAEAARLAGTVHVGGTLDEIEAAESMVWEQQHPEKPFVLVAQHSVFDASRAPEGKHTVWAYCHVPHASTIDMTAAIENQIERFAPGFRQRIIGRHEYNSKDMQAYNPNYIGGDINGGVQDLRQHFTRPAVRVVPYRTPAKGIFICSSSTPPGGGVHGMCGFYAAKAALREM